MTQKITKYGDIGTPEQHANGELHEEIVDGTRVARSSRKSTYLVLYNRKLISGTQRSAAERLEAHCQIGRGRIDCQPRERTNGGSGMSETECQLIHQDLYNKALLSLEMHERPLIISVIIDNNHPTNRTMDAKRRRQRMARLRASLDKLARHYCFS